MFHILRPDEIDIESGVWSAQQRLQNEISAKSPNGEGYWLHNLINCGWRGVWTFVTIFISIWEAWSFPKNKENGRESNERSETKKKTLESREMIFFNTTKWDCYVGDLYWIWSTFTSRQHHIRTIIGRASSMSVKKLGWDISHNMWWTQNK